MDKFELELSSGNLTIELAKNQEDRVKGLSERISINGGMLFVFPYTGKHQMWMKNTLEPLDILFINEKGIVTDIATGKIEDPKLIGTRDDTRFVLELPEGTVGEENIEVGDILPIPVEHSVAEDEQEAPEASLLDEDGNPQMDIRGGERVFSRPKTLEIVKLAKAMKGDEDFEKLGKLVAEEINAQNSRDPQYVQDTKLQYAKDGTKIKVDKYSRLRTALSYLGNPDSIIADEILRSHLDECSKDQLNNVIYKLVSEELYKCLQENEYKEIIEEFPEHEQFIKDAKIVHKANQVLEEDEWMFIDQWSCYLRKKFPMNNEKTEDEAYKGEDTVNESVVKDSEEITEEMIERVLEKLLDKGYTIKPVE